MYKFRTKDERPKDADDIEFEDIIQRKMSFDSMMFVRNGILAALKKKIDMARREEEVATGKLEAAKRKQQTKKKEVGMSAFPMLYSILVFLSSMILFSIHRRHHMPPEFHRGSGNQAMNDQRSTGV